MTFRGWPVGRVLAGLTAAGFTTLIITRNLQTSSRMSLNASQQPAASTAFWRAGPSLLRLRLHSSEQVSPTTKRLRFELPTPDTISGPGLCCESVLLEVSYHLPKLVRYMSNTIADSCSCRPGRRMAKGQPLPHLKAVYPGEPAGRARVSGSHSQAVFRRQNEHTPAQPLPRRYNTLCRRNPYLSLDAK